MNGVTGVGHRTDEEFARFVAGLVRDDAPRLFAIVEEYGEREDAEVAAYGLDFGDHTDVKSVEGDFRLRSQNPQSALAVFGHSTGATGVSRLHLVWLDGAESASPFDVPGR
ncbi:hypothetical protein ACQPZF_31585 [Actinosynnema sp. CS-041913]|uniref:hypothetical protein n=1 Tax=Actinosynnema sp. CS-041913 TaxID=3239917 RepID=UPI003D93C085